MTTGFPPALSFDLPEGWAPVPTQSCGVAGAEFAAVRLQNTADPVVTNLVVSFDTVAGRPDLAAQAQDYLAELSAQYSVSVLASDAVGRGAMSEYNQLLQINYPAGESTIQLKQVRILIEFTNPAGEASGILQVIMTCPADIFPEAGREFQRFVSTISPVL